MHSFQSASVPTPDDYSQTDRLASGSTVNSPGQFSEAVLNFMYEAGLLIVSGDNSVVAVVRDSPLAAGNEVLAYDEPEENNSAVEALGALNADGLTRCTRDNLGRRVYQLSFKGKEAAKTLRFAQRMSN